MHYASHDPIPGPFIPLQWKSCWPRVAAVAQEGVEFRLTGIKQPEAKTVGGDYQAWRFISTVERMLDDSQVRNVLLELCQLFAEKAIAKEILRLALAFDERTHW